MYKVFSTVALRAVQYFELSGPPYLSVLIVAWKRVCDRRTVSWQSWNRKKLHPVDMRANITETVEEDVSPSKPKQCGINVSSMELSIHRQHCSVQAVTRASWHPTDTRHVQLQWVTVKKLFYPLSLLMHFGAVVEYSVSFVVALHLAKCLPVVSLERR